LEINFEKIIIITRLQIAINELFINELNFLTALKFLSSFFESIFIFANLA